MVYSRNLLQILVIEDVKNFIILTVLMLISAVFEVLGIGLVLPFIGLLSSPEWIHSNAMIQLVYDLLSIETDKEFIILLGCLIILLFLIKSAFYIILARYQALFYLGKQHELQTRLFDAYISAPFAFHSSHNSAQLIRNIMAEVASVCNGVLLPLLTLISEGIVIVALLLLLAYINPLIVGVAVLLALLLFWLLTGWLRPQLSTCGAQRVYFGGQMIKDVNQGLGGIKAIKLSRCETFFRNLFSENTRGYIDATRTFTVLNAVPRPLIEAFASTMVISGIIVALMMDLDTGVVISTVTIFAVAFIRLMPSMTKMIAAINMLAFSQKSLEIIAHELSIYKENIGLSSMDGEVRPQRQFVQNLVFDQVFFRYPNSDKMAIKDISFTLQPGESVAFVGHSGSGKSTLIDLALGLLRCEQGAIRIDGVEIGENLANWRDIVGYVPQAIFILDETVRRNVAFGIADADIDDDLVWDALNKASLTEKVNALSDGIDTFLGERGAKLSGGEIQRIGIARALYRKPRLLVFDEATSALDNQTELAVSETINQLMGDVTIMMIAHRLTTVQNCDRIYFMREGEIVASGSYDQLLRECAAFKQFAMVK